MHARRSRVILQPMQQPASTQPSPTLSDFAGLLATIASPRRDTAEDAPPWNSSDPGEDVATLSYEQALRTHARYRALDRDARVDGLPAPQDGVGSGADAAIDSAAADGESTWQPAAAQDRVLRSASVTIRLSKAECARLHRRAAEAGLTVSAYLRSCALEAETLRAQVKQALAEIKAGAEGANQSGGEAAGGSRGKQAAPAGNHRPPGAPAGNKKAGRWSLLGWIGWLARCG